MMPRIMMLERIPTKKKKKKKKKKRIVAPKIMNLLGEKLGENRDFLIFSKMDCCTLYIYIYIYIYIPGHWPSG